MNGKRLFDKGGDVIDLKIKDSTGRILDRFFFKADSEEEFKRMFKIIRSKYKFNFKSKEQSWLDLTDVFEANSGIL